MSKKSLLSLVEQYIRRHPAPAEISLLDGILKLGYSYTMPATNSKNKKQVMLPIKKMEVGTKIENMIPYISWVQKQNRLEEGNTFNSISTEELHQKVFQDCIFGPARQSANKNRWIYVAKKKAEKVKNHFVGGSGKKVYVPDLGQTYDDVTQVGIFIWDLEKKKVFPIDIKIEGDDSEYIFSYPILTNDQGSKLICHGYKRQAFGYGILHCFNRNTKIFEVQISNLGEENSKVIAKQLFSGQTTNMFANISPCYNYICYFAGQGYTHTYYMDLVIMRRDGDQWKENHRIKGAFVGYYDTVRTETFVHEGKTFVYYQTMQECQQYIKRVNLETGQIENVSENKSGESFSISKISKQTGLVIGGYTSHNFNSFFYMRHGEKPQVIPPYNEQDFSLEVFRDPIHGFYLQAKDVDPQFKRQKKPLLLLVHGGPHGHGDACLTLMKYMLLKMGYVVLIPNYSGSVGFGNDYLQRATGNIGSTDAEEIIGLLQNVLKNKEHIDRQRVYVYGGSYGGYMSAIMGSRYDKYFKSAIILNGVLSIPANLWFTDIPEWNTAETLCHNKLEGLTAQDYVKMFQQSPISQPMKIPTLQFLGAKDRRVPYRQGLLFDAITKKVGTPIKTYVYENSAHSLGDSVDTTIDVVIKSLMFLENMDEAE